MDYYDWIREVVKCGLSLEDIEDSGMSPQDYFDSDWTPAEFAESVHQNLWDHEYREYRAS